MTNYLRDVITRLKAEQGVESAEEGTYRSPSAADNQTISLHRPRAVQEIAELLDAAKAYQADFTRRDVMQLEATSAHLQRLAARTESLAELLQQTSDILADFERRSRLDGDFNALTHSRKVLDDVKEAVHALAPFVAGLRLELERLSLDIDAVSAATRERLASEAGDDDFNAVAANRRRLANESGSAERDFLG